MTTNDYSHSTWQTIARKRVAQAIKRGLLPHHSKLTCVVCNRPANAYRHHKGYAPEHRLDVIPVCHPTAHLRNSSDPTTTDYTHDYTPKVRRPPLIIL